MRAYGSWRHFSSESTVEFFSKSGVQFLTLLPGVHGASAWALIWTFLSTPSCSLLHHDSKQISTTRRILPALPSTRLYPGWIWLHEFLLPNQPRFPEPLWLLEILYNFLCSPLSFQKLNLKKAHWGKSRGVQSLDLLFAFIINSQVNGTLLENYMHM